MYETSIKTEGDKRRLFINFKGSNLIPDVARYPEVMRLVIDKLRDFDADELVLSEYYDHIYDVDKTKLLVEISALVQTFENEGIWAPSKLGGGASEHVNRISKRMSQITNVMTLLPADPYLAYRRLKTLHEAEEKIANANDPDYKVFSETLEYMINALENVKLIKLIDATNSQLQEKDLTRTIYGGIFDSGIKPAFIGSRLVSDTSRMTLVDQYSIYGADVYLYKHPEKIELQYYINIPEFTLSPEHYFLLEKTKQIVADQRPSTVGFMDAAQARKYFNKIYLSTIADLAAKNNIKLTITEKEELARIVSRYTIGYGILEILLSDRKLTDIYIDSPIGEKPIYVVHSEYGQCQTNILYSDEEARSIVSKIRALSGRAFDEAHPILDYDLPDLQTRVAIIGKPLALDGIAFAFRLHKETPWTLCQFLDNKMLDKFTAGMMSMLVDAQASMLIVGSRGSGKTSMLQAMMQEIPQNLRILVSEDTQELPIPQLKKMGFSIERMKTRPPLGAVSESEVSAEDALRTALRLGDSVLIVGEVRSLEAKSLYEAMRVGAVGNVVMGTIHGESAFSIWDRVVNDLGVPTTSFKATDFCIVSAPVRFKGSLRRYRRVIQITEVLKGWTKDPQAEHGFIDWLIFDANKDQLIFNEKEVFEKSEWLKKIFVNRGLNREAMFKEINARGEYKWFLVEQKRKNNLPELLEAVNSIRAHNKFALMEEDYRNANNGNLDHDAVLSEWKKWVLETIVQPLIEAKQSK